MSNIIQMTNKVKGNYKMIMFSSVLTFLNIYFGIFVAKPNRFYC